MTGDPLARPPVPHGYAVRLALSHHIGDWKPCVGLPKCEHCAGLERARESLARRTGETGRNRPRGPGESAISAPAATEAPA